MAPMTRTYPVGELRVSDADRDAVISELSEHFQAGRLTKDEFDERTGQALGARTGQDLAALMADLPTESVLAQQPSATGSSLDQTGRRRMPGGWVIVIAAIAAVAITSSALTRHGGFVISFWPALVGFLIFRRVTGCCRRRN